MVARTNRLKPLILLILSIQYIAACGSPSSGLIEDPELLPPSETPEATATIQPTREPELPTPSTTPLVRAIIWSPSPLAINENTATSVELLVSHEAHSGSVTDIALLPGGQQVLSVSSDGEDRIWDVLSLQEIYVSTASIESQARVAVIAENLVMVARDDGGKIVIRDIIGGTILPEVTGWGFGFDGVVFSLDGKRIATQSAGYKIIFVRDVLTGKEIQRISGDWSDTNDYPIFGSFSPDGNILVVTFTNGDMIAYDVTSGEQFHSFVESGPSEFSRDGEILAVPRKNLIRMYDPRSWEVVSELDIGEHRIWGRSFAHHSDLLAVGSFVDGIQIWDTQNGTLLTTLDDISGYFHLRFSSDDRYLFTYGNQFGNINVWGLP